MASEFGVWLKQRREEKGWSGEQLAEALETSQGNVSMYERGKRTPRRARIMKIAEVLEVDPRPGLLAAGYVPISEDATSEEHDSVRSLPPDEARLIMDLRDAIDREAALGPDALRHINELVKRARERKRLREEAAGTGLGASSSDDTADADRRQTLHQ